MTVRDMKVPLAYSEEELLTLVRKALRKPDLKIRSIEILKKSIDARKKSDVHYVLTVLVNEPNPMKQKTETAPVFGGADRPASFEERSKTVVVGSGPAGLFAALTLCRAGVPVVLLERGGSLKDRIDSTERFFSGGELDPESNVQFGEGGAGTFSDGKLQTGTHRGHYNEDVLRTFYEFGAGEEILYEAKPHIGTDVLRDVIASFRAELLRLGAEIRFDSCLTDLEADRNGVSVIVNGKETVRARYLVLATGHSARDTYELLKNKGFLLEAKPFAVGLRIEHPQEVISKALYAESALLLPPAPYKLVGRGVGDRGVYSFCMCPGGYVVNASSEFNRLAVNGMSARARDGRNANSALVVQVRTSDFPDNDPLSGIAFQRSLEEKAFRAASGLIPAQRLGDFLAGKPTEAFGSVVPSTKGKAAGADLNGILPSFVRESLKTALPAFAKTIPGFDDPDAVLSAVESRTSSPVRIVRSERFESSVPNVFPAGEGAGYAGGIVSSAVDGIRVAEEIILRIRESLHG